jgi:hypothetical protein
LACTGSTRVCTTRHTEARIRRQAILTRDDDPCQLHAIIDENALARITDPKVRCNQAARLFQVANRPNITVQILPVSAGVYPVTSEPFLHLAFPGGEHDIIYIETTIYNRRLEEDDEIEVISSNSPGSRRSPSPPSRPQPSSDGR